MPKLWISDVFKDFLFSKGYLVNDTGENRKDCVRALFALGSEFGIKIVSNPQLASWDMVDLASRLIGKNVPLPFYQGFPNSVLALREDQLFLDQLIHYAITYGLGDFSQPGRSLFEEHFERLAFTEQTEPKPFSIVDAEDAKTLMKAYVRGMLASTRPLKEDQEKAVLEYAALWPDDLTECNCKDTAILLLYKLRQSAFARFLQLPDVIRLADEINLTEGLLPKKKSSADAEYQARMERYRVQAEEAERLKAQWDRNMSNYYDQRNCYIAQHAKYREEMQQFEADMKQFEAALLAYKAEQKQYEDALREHMRRTSSASVLNRLQRVFGAQDDPPPVRPVMPQAPLMPQAPAEPIPPAPLSLPPNPLPRMPGSVKKCIRTLNLKNRDRKLIAQVIDFFFAQEGEPNIRDCYEKRRMWSGLLHHIHYAPENPRAAAFADAMRGKGPSLSVYSAFEAAMDQGKIREAAALLAREKGAGAVARNLNYLLSRCGNGQDVLAVLDCLGSPNLILLIQLLFQYRNYHPEERTFRFVRHHKLTVHEETEEENARRRSVLGEDIRAAAVERLSALLRQNLASRQIGKVYVEEGMEKIAVSMQAATGASGFGVLPRGSRVPVGEGNKVRCFTYWEKVNDIDLACFGLKEEGREQIEFSWRTMANKQSGAIVFSGDQTSGFNGGSEFFDLRFSAFQAQYPDIRYVVFTDNIFTLNYCFDKVLCTAGFMIREEEDSGEVFEPKTVKTSFRITGDSAFACLFALDLKKREMIWLNQTVDSHEPVAGEKDIAMVRDYLSVTDFFNLSVFFRGMASEIVKTPEEADVIVADHYESPLREGQTLIRSCDDEKVLAYLNAPPKA